MYSLRTMTNQKQTSHSVL